MKKRRIIASLAILFLGAFLLILIFRGTPEPKYRGIKLSTYLAGFAHDGTGLSSEPPFGLIGTFQPSPERTLVWEVLPEFGTNALPTLVRWLQAKDSRVSQWFFRFVGRPLPLKLRVLSAWEKQQAAISAFMPLGHRASSVLPEILPLLNDPA